MKATRSCEPTPSAARPLATRFERSANSPQVIVVPSWLIIGWSARSAGHRRAIPTTPKPLRPPLSSGSTLPAVPANGPFVAGDGELVPPASLRRVQRVVGSPHEPVGRRGRVGEGGHADGNRLRPAVGEGAGARGGRARQQAAGDGHGAH